MLRFQNFYDFEQRMILSSMHVIFNVSRQMRPGAGYSLMQVTLKISNRLSYGVETWTWWYNSEMPVVLYLASLASHACVIILFSSTHIVHKLTVLCYYRPSTFQKLWHEILYNFYSLLSIPIIKRILNILKLRDIWTLCRIVLNFRSWLWWT